ncbi:DUF1778 domain-containing protein [Klebsiella quasipneumoniae subsp. similipneumoniae]|uniref:type II toxin -antitoxin system TacA 1-like antitoxin n=1 Tax=Klebsiella quasipneumoniae TaxID=1463165 RepID=UPI003D075A64
MPFSRLNDDGWMYDNIDITLPSNSVKMIEEAVAISGVTVSQFILRCAYECAVEIVEHYNNTC